MKISNIVKLKFSRWLRVLLMTFSIILIPLILVTMLFYEQDISLFDLIAIVIVLFISISYSVNPLVGDYLKLANYIKHLSFNRIIPAPILKSAVARIELANLMFSFNKIWANKHHELGEKVAQVNLLLKSIPEILFIINEDLVITHTNTAAENAFDYSMVGRSIEEIIDNRLLLGAIKWVIHDSKGQRLDIILASPQFKSYQVMIEMYDSKQENEKNLIIMMHDVTEMKRTEKMLSDFVTNASHEIRTPLTGIIGMIETLEQDKWKDKQAIKEFMPKVIAEAYRLKNLTDALLSLSSIERKLNTQPTEVIYVKQIIRSCVDQLKWKLNEANVKVKFSMRKRELSVIGDSFELNQLFNNLISNAINYGGCNKEIHIRVTVKRNVKSNTYGKPADQFVCISIRDEGEGIESKHIPRLTERFYRVDKSRSRKVGGTGLGLSIVKQIVTRHKGWLNIKSEINQGSIFSVYIPFKEHHTV